MNALTRVVAEQIPLHYVPSRIDTRFQSQRESLQKIGETSRYPVTRVEIPVETNVTNVEGCMKCLWERTWRTEVSLRVEMRRKEN